MAQFVPEEVQSKVCSKQIVVCIQSALPAAAETVLLHQLRSSFSQILFEIENRQTDGQFVYLFRSMELSEDLLRLRR